MAIGELHLVMPKSAGSAYSQIAATGGYDQSVSYIRAMIGHEATILSQFEALDRRLPLTIDEIRQGDGTVGLGIQSARAIAACIDAGDGG